MRPTVPALARGALLGVATGVGLRVSSDPDLWGHLRFGLDFLDAGGVANADPYSFTSDVGWVNHEWLFEVLMAVAYRAVGPLGLALLACALAVGAMLLARAVLRRAGLEGAWLDVVTAAVFLTGIAPLAQTVRPQAMSALLFVALLACVRACDAGRRGGLLMLPPLFLLWANVHGAWVMGGGVLAVWAVTRVSSAPRSPQALTIIGAGAAAALGTLVTPYGPGLWRFLLETVRFERVDIPEWHPVSTDAAMFAVWCGVSLVLVAAAWRVPRGQRVYVAMCAVLAMASFRVMRVLPFYSTAVLLLLSPVLLPHGVGVRQSWPTRDRVGATAMWAVCVGGALLGSVEPACLQPAGRFVLDGAAGSFLRANHAAGRMLVYFDWGEYALWHFGPALQVSIDGRRETTYSATTITAHQRFFQNGEGARGYLEALDPDLIWLPKALPVSDRLDEWGWRPVFDSDQSRVWARKGVPSAWQAATQPGLPSCFPGP